jgi:hypothetical protein
MFQWLKNLFARRRTGDFELIAEYPERGPAKPYPDGAKHLFVRMQGKGVAYLGLVKSAHEATDTAQAAIGRIVMQTGEVTAANYWTSATEALDPVEHLAVEAARLARS